MKLVIFLMRVNAVEPSDVKETRIMKTDVTKQIKMTSPSLVRAVISHAILIGYIGAVYYHHRYWRYYLL